MLERRVFGTEMEFGCHPVLPPGSPYANHFDWLLDECRPEMFVDANGINHPIRWQRLKGYGNDGLSSNGGRLYYDLSHPEYATPTTWDLTELVAANRAGERMVGNTLTTAQTEGKLSDFILSNRVLDENGKTWGYHENYLVDLRHIHVTSHETHHQAATAILGAHLATRNIFCGAGAIFRSGFLVAQKASNLEDYTSDRTTLLKPLINLRMEHHTGEGTNLGRLHITSGDPHMSAWALKMSVGTTCILLSMIEDGVKFPDAVHLRPASMHFIAKKIAADPTCKTPFKLADGHTTTNAIQVQRAFVETAKQWAKTRSRALTEDESFILEQWEKAVADLDQNVGLLIDRADWVSKYLRIAGLVVAQNQRIDSENEARSKVPGYTPKPYVTAATIDLQFDRLLSKGSIGEWMRQNTSKTGWHKWEPPAALIEERMYRAPEGRARLIGDFILQHIPAAKELSKLKEVWGRPGYPAEPSVNWDRAIIRHNKQRYHAVIADPRSTDQAAFAAHVQRAFDLAG